MGICSVTPVLNVSSIGDSFAWFESLGWKRGFSWNDGGMIEEAQAANENGPAGFGSVCSGHATIFLCCGTQGSRGTIMPKFPGDDQTDGVWMSWWMVSPADVDDLHAIAVKSGMTVTYPPTNEPWGVHEFHLRHPDGHMFRVSTASQESWHTNPTRKRGPGYLGTTYTAARLAIIKTESKTPFLRNHE